MRRTTHIMLIDDNEVDNFIHQKVIEGLGLNTRIQIFTSAIMALDYLQLIESENAYARLFAPHIILLDINMPTMDGFEFLDEFDKLDIFKLINPIDIFIVSSSTNPSDIERARKNKLCTAYINKPLTAETLADLIK